MKCEVPLTPEQRLFAAEHHDLVYKFLRKKQLSMQNQNVHSTWVVSSAISIRNNWNVVLANYDLPCVFIKRLADLERVRPGDFVLLTLNKVSAYKKHLRRHMKRLHQNIQFILDESDEISNPDSARSQAVLSCFQYWSLAFWTAVSLNGYPAACFCQLLPAFLFLMLILCTCLSKFLLRSFLAP